MKEKESLENLTDLIKSAKLLPIEYIEDTEATQEDKINLYREFIREKVAQVIEVLKGNSFTDVQNILQAVNREVEHLIHKAII